MKRSDRLLLISTFMVGFIVGVYVYFVGFSGFSEQVEERVAEVAPTLEIVGEAYGGCERGNFCPTFKIFSDGSYRYFYRPGDSTDQVRREGELPDELWERLQRVSTTDRLTIASESIEPAFCESYVDGIDVRYEVDLGSKRFELDSCGSAVDPDGALWQSYSLIWTYFERVS